MCGHRLTANIEKEEDENGAVEHGGEARQTDAVAGAPNSAVPGFIGSAMGVSAIGNFLRSERGTQRNVEIAMFVVFHMCLLLCTIEGSCKLRGGYLARGS